ncbi:tRNA pseudouridine(38-40) synthase TruA [Neomoorella thermoacetica]|uniref:tRNA pseudouridine synthase A n=2 Tax=Neomoorella thermoacetica TaxID=1525 RepID=A0AAC9HKR7_NEOTH|nr:tRNA pseudouridine(38-40) synthase TruA [Moorella thermoacetica]AOQ25400.1 tRNA pseudouridine synthase A [Moorella thermoacetica]APC09624.1 tRNA pseudouridine synthase A [Moorella thermoacetica]OIQ54099.1 tRNA pseudouridine synthase A [Moorella thermoacetica]TYL11962.1 tRNA pseudouridine synthase A [Moorella thermoacetica]GAF25659.1 pseudouridylate synthase [Moorella thermoacetica Y72]
MPCLKITLAYDGSNYAGWQVQPEAHGPTVQGEVAAALKRLTGEEITPVAAGRTDAGVHARGQVISFSTRARIPVERWPLALNSVLPADIAALEAVEVAPDFHARYCARRKWYRYTIYNNRVPDVFCRRYSWHLRQPLDVAAMARAAAYLQGCHDFRSFCAAGSPVRHFERQVQQASVSQNGPFIYFDVIADGFLYHMVRIMVGTLVEIGRRRLVPEAIPAILAARSREKAGPTAPARGLCLERVEY